MLEINYEEVTIYLHTSQKYQVCTSVPPKWNYKKANWLLYQQRRSVLTKHIHIDDKDINKFVKDLIGCIIQAAKEAIPKDARKDYKPYWNAVLDKLHNELNTAVYVPTFEKITTLNK